MILLNGCGSSWDGSLYTMTFSAMLVFKQLILESIVASSIIKAHIVKSGTIEQIFGSLSIVDHIEFSLLYPSFTSDQTLDT